MTEKLDTSVGLWPPTRMYTHEHVHRLTPHQTLFSHFAGILKSLITEDNVVPIRTIGSLAQEPLSFLGVSRERWLAHLPHGAWAQQGESPCELVVLVMGHTGQLSLSVARCV